MKSVKTYLSIILLALTLQVSAQTKSPVAEAYIEKYSSVAIEEMCRCGIPASITLAQGLLESGYGGSTLAKEANNHFGIKCHSDWTGETIYHDDDAKGECFRKYPSAVDSYKDHSDFLRFKSRYAFLFDFELTDYKAWAYGLKKAGYATAPTYAESLIRIIETYDLSRFDVLQPAQQELIPETPQTLEQPRSIKPVMTGTFSVSLERETMEVNGVPFIISRGGESYESIAALYDVFLSELLKWNDISAKNTPLKPGTRVFLGMKKSEAAKGLDKHICTEGESLADISSKYAIKMKSLLKMNHNYSAETLLKEDDTVIIRRSALKKQK